MFRRNALDWLIDWKNRENRLHNLPYYYAGFLEKILESIHNKV